MKKIITAILLLVSVGAFSQVPKEIIWNEYTKGKTVELTEMPDSSIQLLNFPFKTKFENKKNQPTKFTYEQEGKEISFIPYQVRIRSKQNKVINVQKVLSRKTGNKEVTYDNIFGSEISIVNQVSERGYRKLIKIENTQNFATLLNKVDSIEIVFEIPSLTFDGIDWDKQSTKYFTSPVLLDSLNKIEAISVWDNDTSIVTKAKLFVENGKMYFSKVIPTSFLLSSNRTVWTDATITFGTESFISNAGEPTVIPLSSTTFVICYRMSNNPYCIAGTINGTTITFGAQVQLASASSIPYGLVGFRVDDTRFGVGFVSDDGTNYRWNVRVGSVSSNTITLGTNVNYFTRTYSNTDPQRSSGFAFSGTDIAAVVSYYNYDDGVYYQYVYHYTLSNLTLTYANFINTYSSTPPSNNWVVSCALSSTTGVLLIGNLARIVYLNGSSITWGTPYQFFASGLVVVSVTRISDTKFAIAWVDNIYQQQYGKVKIGEVSSTSVITYGATSSTFCQANLNAMQISYLDASNLLLCYVASGVAINIAKTVSISGNTVLSFGDDYSFSSYDISYIGNPMTSTALSATTFLMAFYVPNGPPYNLNIKVGKMSISGKKINGVTYSKWNGVTITKLNNQ